MSFFACAGNVSATTSVAVTKPSNLAAGDILIAFVAAYRSASAAPGNPSIANTGTGGSSWSAVTVQTTGTNYKCAYAWKAVTSAADGSVTAYTWSATSAANMAAGVIAMRGRDILVPYLISNTAYITSDTNIRAASLTLAAGDDVVWCGYNYRSTVQATVIPSGWTSGTVQTAAAAISAGIAYKENQSAGATNAVNGTMANAVTIKHAFMFGLRSAPNGTGALTGGAVQVAGTGTSTDPVTGTGAVQTGPGAAAGVEGDAISIERKDGAGSYAEVAYRVWSGSPWSDTSGLTSGHTYTYRAKHLNSQGASAYSNEPSVAYSTDITGTGALTLGVVQAAGTGTGPTPVTGTGAAQAGAVQANSAASGVVGYSGTGALTAGATAANSDANGSVGYSGTGALATGAAQVGGAGWSGSGGSGALTIGVVAVGGSGTVSVTNASGTGALQAGAIAAAGAGTAGVTNATGTGSLTAGAGALAGSGSVGADTISIERKDGAGSYSEVHSGDWSGSPWTDTGPFTGGHTYTYRARRTTSGATSGYSNEASVTYDDGSRTGSGAITIGAVSLSGSGSVPRIYVSYVTGLQPGTHYYLRAYGTNADGTGYGSDVEFTTPVDSVSGAAQVGAAQASGSGTILVTGSGALGVKPFGLVGIGTSATPSVNGVGALQTGFPSALGAGSAGNANLTGTGHSSAGAATLYGDGSVSVVGTGAVSAYGASLLGIGNAFTVEAAFGIGDLLTAPMSLLGAGEVYVGGALTTSYVMAHGLGSVEIVGWPGHRVTPGGKKPTRPVAGSADAIISGRLSPIGADPIIADTVEVPV